MNREIFISNSRSSGDLAGVFEADEETAYFYLYAINRQAAPKILSALNITKFVIGMSEKSISINWDKKEGRCGVFIKDRLTAVYDVGLLAETGGKVGKYIGREIPNACLFS
jgi:hypothetical protein